MDDIDDILYCDKCACVIDDEPYWNKDETLLLCCDCWAVELSNE